MKRLLLILSSLTVTTSLTTTVVACSTFKSVSIKSLNLITDLTKDTNGKEIVFGIDNKKLNQKDLLVSLIMLNHPELQEKLDQISKLDKQSKKREVQLLTQREYELYADLFFDLKTLDSNWLVKNDSSSTKNNVNTYKITLKPNKHSKVLTGQEIITIKATDEAVAKLVHPVQDIKPSNSTYWYQWSTISKPANSEDENELNTLTTENTYLYDMTVEKNKTDW